MFEWLPEEETPLVVDDGIELPQVIIMMMVMVMVIILLPQLELIQNFTADCTTNYSTGSFTCLEVVFRFKRRLGWVLQTFFLFFIAPLYTDVDAGTSCSTHTSPPV